MDAGNEGRGGSLKSKSTFLSGLGESEDGYTLSGVEESVEICQEGQRKEYS